MLNLLRRHLLGRDRVATPSSQPAEALPCCAADAAANGEKQREGMLPGNHLVLLPGNHPQSIRVRRMAAALIAAACDGVNYGQRGLSPRIRRPFRSVDWSVGVLVDDAEYVNAFSTMDGRIWVTAGLLRYRDAAVAAVLAHEIGHVIARHAERRMRNWALAGFLANFAGELLDAPPGEEAERDALRSLFMRPCYYSNEYEADRLGLLLLAAAGCDPRVILPMYRFLWLGEMDDTLLLRYPAGDKRFERLSQAKDQALDLYKQAARSARQG